MSFAQLKRFVPLNRLAALRRRRVPLFRQLSETECGAACVAMILNFYGQRVSVSECRDEMGIGRDGATAGGIVKVARAHGLRVKGYSIGPAEFKYVHLPAIIHWEFKHFLVVERWSPKGVVVLDPAVGRRRLTAAEFDAGFTGVVLTLEPEANFKRRRATTAPPWHTFLTYLWHKPGLLAQIVCASFLLQLLGLALPVFTKVLVDHVLAVRGGDVLTMFGLGMLFVFLSLVVTSYLRSTLLVYLQTRLDAQMMLNFFGHLLTLPYSFFQQRTSGDLLMRLSSNAIIREILTGQTLSVILDGSLVFIYLLIMLAQAPSFGLLVLALGLTQIAGLLLTARRVHLLMQSDLAAQSEAQSYLVEALSRMETLKASGVEDRVMDRWSSLFFNQLNVSLQRARVSIFVETLMGGLRVFAPFLLLWFGAYKVLDGSLSLGTMLALNALAAAFLAPLSSLVSNAQRLQVVRSHLERITDVLSAEPEQVTGASRRAPQLTGEIELRGVSFRYSDNAPLVLRNVSLKVRAGQKVALVGRTGSGKSTLGKLLLGLYQPSEGQILYDGVPLQQMNYRTLRQQFGVVLQDSMLFRGSIRQNIAFDDPALPLERVVEAARLAKMDEEISSMPMGYETLVSEGAPGFAGGQCQRLSLARALAHRPAILLLDEATSHLDVITEQQVERNLSQLDCTRIVIAHRLSTIRNADMILVLDDGKIVERGTHEELLALDGRYAELVRAAGDTESKEAVL